MSETWDFIRMVHSMITGATPLQVDLVADWEIITEFVAGKSNNSISDNLDISLDDVVEVLKSYFGFGGWEFNLGINIYTIYTSSLKEPKTFYRNMQMLSFSEGIICKALEVCLIFDKLREEKEKYDNAEAG